MIVINRFFNLLIINNIHDPSHLNLIKLNVKKRYLYNQFKKSTTGIKRKRIFNVIILTENINCSLFMY